MADQIILLGDSIIDNAPYVGMEGHELAWHLANQIPRSDVRKRALDGARIQDVLDYQLSEPLPAQSDVVLSVGGNDALSHIDLLTDGEPWAPVELLARLHSIRETFRVDYASLLNKLSAHDGQVFVLTIYNAYFPMEGYPEAFQLASETALSIFNDVIQEEVRKWHFTVIDTREVINTPDCYWNPIEINDYGGSLLAHAIANALTRGK